MPDQTWNDRRTNGKPLLLRLTVVCLYASLAIWSTWPLALDPLRKLPVGDDAIATVPLFNLWSVWWNADRAATGYRDYWNAPIFHPVPDAFAFSEPQPLTVMVAPFLWLTGSRVLAYNVYLWLSLGLNGVMAERLLRTMGVARCTAILGGCLMLLLPFVHWQREVLQLFPVWGLLWTLSELLKLLRRPSRWTGLQLGLALTASIFLCVHQTLLLLVVLAGAAWVSLDRWGEARWWSALLVAGAVSAGLAGPLLWKQWSVLESYDFAREHAAVESLSAHPGDYRASAGRSWIPGETDSLRNGPPLGAGWLRSALAMVGLCIGVRRRRPRRAALLLGTIVVLAAGLSLGLNLAIGSWQPWQSLVAIVPGLAQVRSVYRFAAFVQMGIVLLAALALDSLMSWGRVSLRRSTWRVAFTPSLTVLALATLFEIWPNRYLLSGAPDPRAHREWIEFVGKRLSPGRTIVCLPLPPGHLVQDFTPTTRWMYLQTFHGMPLLNGYSGFFPESDVRLRMSENSRLPLLAEVGVQYVVVFEGGDPAEMLRLSATEEKSLRLALNVPDVATVYELQVDDTLRP